MVIDSNGSPGKVIEWHGEKSNLLKSDQLVIRSNDVRHVRWFPPRDRASAFLCLRLGARAAARLQTRSTYRMSMFDALFIDYRLYDVSLYRHVFLYRLCISDRSPARLKRVYRLPLGESSL